MTGVQWFASTAIIAAMIEIATEVAEDLDGERPDLALALQQPVTLAAVYADLLRLLGILPPANVARFLDDPSAADDPLDTRQAA